jgi:16S rRNA (guanine966-N2)-methyltransferase
LSGLRVISGIARGRKLQAVPGDSTRPITDRTKESLFNIIGADLENASFLDLFAGTGSVGIEALSRGAYFVRFIDINHRAILTIRTNLHNTGFNQGVEVIQMDAFTLLAQDPDRPFDYIYIAPPQYKDLWKKSLIALDTNPAWLAQDAWIIAQIHPIEYSEKTSSQILEFKNFSEFDQRRYGSTLLVFYGKKGE